MFRKPPHVKVVDKVPEGTWRIPDGARLTARLGTNPRVIMRKVVLAEPKSGHFDAIVEVIPKNGPSMGEFIRVSSGGLAGMLIPFRTPKMVIKPKRGSSGTKKQTAAPKEQKQSAAQSQTEDFKRGRKFEYERIKGELGLGREPAPRTRKGRRLARRDEPSPDPGPGHSHLRDDVGGRHRRARRSKEPRDRRRHRRTAGPR